MEHTLEALIEQRRAFYNEKVQHGIELLDEQRPGWRDELKSLLPHNRLDISDCDRCILGYLYAGGFTAGVAELEINDFSGARKFGFDTDLNDAPFWVDAIFNRLLNAGRVMTQYGSEITSCLVWLNEIDTEILEEIWLQRLNIDSSPRSEWSQITESRLLLAGQPAS